MECDKPGWLWSAVRSVGKSTALQRALLYLAFGYLGNRGAARRDSQTINVFERTEEGEGKKSARNVGKPDRTVRTHYYIAGSNGLLLPATETKHRCTDYR